MTKPGSKRSKQNQAFESIIGKTLRELQQDIYKISKTDGDRLRTAMEQSSGEKDDSRLTRELMLPNSQLYTCLLDCKTLLENDASGRKYLEILGMLKPALQPTVVSPRETTVASDAKVPQVNNAIPEEVARILENSEMLHSLTQNFVKDLNLEEKLATGGELNMTELIGMMGTLVTNIQTEITRDESKFEKLKSECVNMMKCAENNPMLKDKIAQLANGNTQMAGIATMMNMLGGDGLASMMNLGGDVLTTMNLGGDGTNTSIPNIENLMGLTRIFAQGLKSGENNVTTGVHSIEEATKSMEEETKKIEEATKKLQDIQADPTLFASFLKRTLPPGNETNVEGIIRQDGNYR